MSEPNKACCTIPPIIAKDYEPKGKYITVAGLKTYYTSPPTPTASILFIYDIFGYFPQTIQGADILAHAGGFAVYMPDWFEGRPADISWYPPDTKEKGEALKAFFVGTGSVGPVVERARGVLAELSKESEGGKWGAFGLCWGGKVVTVLSASPTPLSVAASAHPAMVDPSDALKAAVPTALLASKDEDPATIQKFAENLGVEKLVETYGDQIHGWMGARGDLEEEKCRKEYERGYKTIVEFFSRFV